MPPEEVEEARDVVGETGLTVVGETVEKQDANVRMDDEPLGRRGYEH
jgi:thiamine monophosphate kinase